MRLLIVSYRRVVIGLSSSSRPSCRVPWRKSSGWCGGGKWRSIYHNRHFLILQKDREKGIENERKKRYTFSQVREVNKNHPLYSPQLTSALTWLCSNSLASHDSHVFHFPLTVIAFTWLLSLFPSPSICLYTYSTFHFSPTIRTYIDYTQCSVLIHCHHHISASTLLS